MEPRARLARVAVGGPQRGRPPPPCPLQVAGPGSVGRQARRSCLPALGGAPGWPWGPQPSAPGTTRSPLGRNLGGWAGSSRGNGLAHPGRRRPQRKSPESRGDAAGSSSVSPGAPLSPAPGSARPAPRGPSGPRLQRPAPVCGAWRRGKKSQGGQDPGVPCGAPHTLAGVSASCDSAESTPGRSAPGSAGDVPANVSLTWARCRCRGRGADGSGRVGVPGTHQASPRCKLR